MQRFRGLLLIAGVALMVAGFPVSAANVVDDWAGRALDRINEHRAFAKLPALELDPALMRAAMAHTRDMAENDVFDHVGSDGAGLQARLKAVEYPFHQAAENIAGGIESPEITVDRWMTNAGHRHNILGPAFRDAGIGYLYRADDGGKVRYRHYWTLILGVKKKRIEIDPEPILAPLSPR
jgi:uncharacterized protein YkwD